MFGDEEAVDLVAEGSFSVGITSRRAKVFSDQVPNEGSCD